MTFDWKSVRERLDAAAVALEAVRLPGDRTVPWEGALDVSEAAAGRWDLKTVDYGQARTLLSRTTKDEIASALYAYLLSPLPPHSLVETGEYERLLNWAAPHILDLLGRADQPLVIDAPEGLLLDRIGALDGFFLYPARTSFEARSLPPSAVDQPLHEFLTATTIRFEVQRTAPWFGRPGGGLRFCIVEPGVGVRDLVREGRLTQIAHQAESELA
ncbi:hypothetical protein FHS07_001498 [Microbacterium proteolyticum]|uniref:TNT domain-containing protein n=1 Tax=Microbacterium proteolyticum TaxID=1572644 RepID=A0A7W5CID1_9MICO|nr:TNT domain-containing protein [Microbacterium proteolyticum]MBB3157814.1 hypothetical protein [Microbacterium proteolyticum]